MKKTKVWRLTVSVTDTPADGESFTPIDEIINYVNISPLVGMNIKVTDYEDYGFENTGSENEHKII